MTKEPWFDRSLKTKNYFRSYKKRYPHKGVEPAIDATRNWLAGTIRPYYDGKIPKNEQQRIERILNKIRLEEK